MKNSEQKIEERKQEVLSRLSKLENSPGSNQSFKGLVDYSGEIWMNDGLVEYDAFVSPKEGYEVWIFAMEIKHNGALEAESYRFRGSFSKGEHIDILSYKADEISGRKGKTYCFVRSPDGGEELFEFETIA